MRRKEPIKKQSKAKKTTRDMKNLLSYANMYYMFSTLILIVFFFFTKRTTTKSTKNFQQSFYYHNKYVCVCV